MVIKFHPGNELLPVVGAGLMGTGIAHVASQAGHRVMLFDTRPDVAAAALVRLSGNLQALVGKGRMSGDTAAQVHARSTPGFVVNRIARQASAWGRAS